MQLHSDKVFHFDKTYLPSSARTSRYHRSLPTSRTLPIEELQNEISDQKCLLKRGDYSIRLADSPGRYSLVNKLIRNMYAWRGYHTEETVISSHNPNQLTLESSIGQHLAGTLTIGLDSNEGMLVDALYEQEILAFRKKNRRLCELSKLAIKPQYSSKELFASLVNIAYIYARIIHNVQDAFIEINPRHVGFYKRMLGFRQIGAKRTCQRVDAPAVLLHLELDYMDEQISSLAGSREPAKERSLYAYFLTKHEEERIASSLRRHINSAAALQQVTAGVDYQV